MATNQAFNRTCYLLRFFTPTVFFNLLCNVSCHVLFLRKQVNLNVGRKGIPIIPPHWLNLAPVKDVDDPLKCVLYVVQPRSHVVEQWWVLPLNGSGLVFLVHVMSLQQSAYIADAKGIVDLVLAPRCKMLLSPIPANLSIHHGKYQSHPLLELFRLSSNVYI